MQRMQRMQRNGNLKKETKKNARKQKHCNKNATTNGKQMQIYINPAISIINLNASSLNASIKKQRQSEWIKK